MLVEEVKTGARIRPDRVYVIPPNTFMAINEGTFTLTPRRTDAGLHLSVDFFMRSLAQERKSGAIGVILSGTGADGTVGLEAIKAEGGITFSQDPSTARFDGMPRSAIDSGCVDFVLSPEGIAAELRQIGHHLYIRAEGRPVVEQAESARGAELSEVPVPLPEKTFMALLDNLRKASGVDFSQYRPNTILRRASRRTVILKLQSLEEYEHHLKSHPEEALNLYEDVLIPVTSFFRALRRSRL